VVVEVFGKNRHELLVILQVVLEVVEVVAAMAIPPVGMAQQIPAVVVAVLEGRVMRRMDQHCLAVTVVQVL
jgi:hypothetical protein